MARIRNSLGGGISDATGTYGTISTATDYVSAWTPATGSAFAHGGFDVTNASTSGGTTTFTFASSVSDRSAYTYVIIG